MHLFHDNAEAFFNWFFGLLQGDLPTLSTLDPQAVQDYKIEHDKEIRENPTPFNIVYVVLKK